MNKKNGLDERQREQCNAIGNQMFIAAFYLLMLDAGLYGFGVKWLPYPANVMVIITVCMAVYLVRLIALGSYVPPEGNAKKPMVRAALSSVMAIVLALILAFAANKTHLAQAVDSQGDNSAVILMIVSGIGLLVSAAVAIIKRVRDGKGE